MATIAASALASFAIQTGTLRANMDTISLWTLHEPNPHHPRRCIVMVRFPTPFRAGTRPDVTVALSGLDASHNENLHISVDVLFAGAKFFLADLVVKGTSVVYGANVTWTAYGVI